MTGEDELEDEQTRLKTRGRGREEEEEEKVRLKRPTRLGWIGYNAVSCCIAGTDSIDLALARTGSPAN